MRIDQNVKKSKLNKAFYKLKTKYYLYVSKCLVWLLRGPNDGLENSLSWMLQDLTDMVGTLLIINKYFGIVLKEKYF